MRQVNLIPQSYFDRQARRRRVWREVLLVALAVLCLGGWTIFQQISTRHLRDYARTLEGQIEAQRDRLNELDRLQSVHQRLRRRLGVQRRLAQSLSHTQMLAVLGATLPDSVVFTDLKMETIRPRGESGQAHQDGPAPQRVELSVQAQASNDMVVADLVAALEEHPVFTSVSMRRNETVEGQGGEVRAFQLRLSIDLNRRFVPADSKEQGGMAHVD